MIKNFATFVNEIFDTRDYYFVEENDEYIKYEFIVDEEKYTAIFHKFKRNCYIFTFFKGKKIIKLTNDRKSFRVLSNIYNLTREFLDNHEFYFFGYVSMEKGRDSAYTSFLLDLSKRYNMKGDIINLSFSRTLYYITNLYDKYSTYVKKLTKEIDKRSFTSPKKVDFKNLFD